MWIGGKEDSDEQHTDWRRQTGDMRRQRTSDQDILQNVDIYTVIMVGREALGQRNGEGVDKNVELRRAISGDCDLRSVVRHEGKLWQDSVGSRK